MYSSLKKKIKYLGINLTKNVNNLYKENYKPLKRDQGSLQKVEMSYLLCSWIDRINIVKMATLQKTIYMFSAPHQNPNEIHYRD
jgi:hypothetical protein